MLIRMCAPITPAFIRQATLVTITWVWRNTSTALLSQKAPAPTIFGGGAYLSDADTSPAVCPNYRVCGLVPGSPLPLGPVLQLCPEGVCDRMLFYGSLFLFLFSSLPPSYGVRVAARNVRDR
eukprot:TRINITY_DN69132_c0_g1_i1.p2 TRINITY_DN69132_c0_g1~~TRINITY_DN69132_c0_g1_i1.p2  ORF type:complete len:122 (+),score=0.39 TRINITY_DN69132_c0_g1_i1:516-881(+)